MKKRIAVVMLLFCIVSFHVAGCDEWNADIQQAPQVDALLADLPTQESVTEAEPIVALETPESPRPTPSAQILTPLPTPMPSLSPPPLPTPTPEPTPESTPTTTPRPTPVQTPQPTPSQPSTPAPQPTPALTPVPTPEPIPSPTPEPTPTPTPTTEPTPEYTARTICNTCGADITDMVPEHGTVHLHNGENFSYRVE